MTASLRKRSPFSSSHQIAESVSNSFRDLQKMTTSESFDPVNVHHLLFTIAKRRHADLIRKEQRWMRDRQTAEQQFAIDEDQAKKAVPSTLMMAIESKDVRSKFERFTTDFPLKPVQMSVARAILACWEMNPGPTDIAEFVNKDPNHNITVASAKRAKEEVLSKFRSFLGIK
jgi:hypothetical protein